MAIAGPAQDADSRSWEPAKTRLRLRYLASCAPKLLTVCVVFCAMAVAGCTRNPERPEFNSAQHEVRAAPARAPARPRKYTEPVRHAELKIHRPDPELLAPQPAPDCEFTRTDIKTVDPNEWARLKIDYERQCYQDAEKIARERLRLLQASSTCEIDPGLHRRPAR